MKNILVVLLAVVVVSGCTSITAAPYSVSGDTHQALKNLTGANKIVVDELKSVTTYSWPLCGQWFINAVDGLTISQFVSKALNDELKFADLHDPGGRRISGEMTKMEFSSGINSRQGWWDLGVTLRSSNGVTVNTENRYTFESSSYASWTACNQTAQALNVATQDLILKLVSNPAFPSLLQ